jgi:ribosomal protein S19E (S16A)
MSNPKQDLWLGALGNLKQLDGVGHLRDIRFGAYRTTKGRAWGGKDVQTLAYDLEKEGLIEKVRHDTYRLTEQGRKYLEQNR